MENLDRRIERENVYLDREEARALREDDRYLAAHPDPYAGVSFRTAQVTCPICKQTIPYRGCSLHIERHPEATERMIHSPEQYLVS